ncbi:hypothetical protein D3C73_1012590 [compost metagenome]
MGVVGNIGQPAAGPRRTAAAPATGTDHGGRTAAAGDDPQPAARARRTLSMGRASRSFPASARARCSVPRAQQPALHQYACAGGTVAPGPRSGVAGGCRHARPAPRLVGSHAAPAGGRRTACGHAAVRGGHVQPGSGRGLSGSGPGAAAGQSEGCRPPASAGRACAPSARRQRRDTVHSQPRTGTGRVRGGPTRAA